MTVSRLWQVLFIISGIALSAGGVLGEASEGMRAQSAVSLRAQYAQSGNSTLPGPGSWVDARAYGARGDGTTDDTEALRAALVAASDGVLYLPKGTYLVTNSLNVPSNTEVRGAGPLTTIIKHGAGVAVPPIVVPGTSASVLLAGLAVDGNQSGNSSFDFEELSIARGATDVTVQRVRIFNMNKIGIATEGTRVRILDSLIVGVGNATRSTAAMGIWSGSNSQLLTISGCVIRDMRVNGIFVGGGNTAVVSNNLLLGNHTQTAPVGGGQIYIAAGARTTLVTGNTVQAGGGMRTSGLEVDAGNGTMVVGNLITDQPGYGIVLQSGGDVYIANNVVKNNGHASAGASAIRVHAGISGFTVIGNRAFDDRASKTQSWGLEIAPGPSDNYVVVANDFRGNVDPTGITDGGTGVNKYVWGNLPLTSPVSVHRTPYQWTGGSGPSALSRASTEYLPASGLAAPTTSEAYAETLVATDMQVELFRVTLSAAPGNGNSRTFTIRKNGFPTPASVTVSGNNRSAVWRGTVSFAAGDRVSIESGASEQPIATHLWFAIRLTDRVP